MSSTTTSWLVSGRPRQFIEMCANSRCSIRFHLLVPGGAVVTGDSGLLTLGDYAGIPIMSAAAFVEWREATES